MSSLTSLLKVKPANTISFGSRQELETYMSLAAEEGVTSLLALHLFEHFIWSLDGRRAYLNASAWTVNHGDVLAANIAWSGDAGGQLVGTAIQDMAANTELLMDYRLFRMPSFYSEFCSDHGEAGSWPRS